MGIFNADVIINISPAFFSLQKSGLVRVYLTSVFLLLSVPRCFGDPKPQFDWGKGEGFFFFFFFFWGEGEVIFQKQTSCAVSKEKAGRVRGEECVRI